MKAYYEKSLKRTNCPARLNAVLKSNGKWQVTKVQTNHNHDLDTSMCRLMAGHKNLNPEVRRNREANDIAGFRPCKSTRLLEVQYAMGDIHPKAIISDQCESIKKAILEIMSNIVHISCLWHILCKVPKKFRSIANYDIVVHEFKAIIYDNLTVEMFESNWDGFMERHGLQGNEWLLKLFRERTNWVPIYLNNILWVGMLSTQGDEVMHAYFDGSKDIVLKCIYEFELERQFQRAFTNGMFRVVQDEIRRMLYCNVTPHIDEEVQNKLEYLDKRLEDLKAELLNWQDGMNVQEENSNDVIVRQLDDDNRGRNTIVFDIFVTWSRRCPRSNDTDHDANSAKIM
ncbi:protein FAR1-RELATED SEQUENCE 6-like [Pistacia vera]|uniref:protein FAR1-RELATED SEQUENCE 6-like n=1 Tax=Pistacia vera TaxID=55513 RepID=UPI001262D274|nr:protein FAR1-RELATED SEQUENCE 6-like [Pistacia vera]